MNVERFIERVPESGCWIWIGVCFPNGYGRVCVQRNKKRRAFMAHRVVYQTYVGPIPIGLDIDHLCRVRCCVNPSHLEPVTRRLNLERGGILAGLRARAAAMNAATVCSRGHQMTPENTYIYPSGRHRACKECMRSLNREWVRRNSALVNSRKRNRRLLKRSA
jgi:hypothetical protein